MKRFGIAAAAVVCGLSGCANMPGGDAGGGWVTLIDAASLGSWDRVGDANWRVDDGAVVADKGVGFLVSKTKYANFELRAEFYAEADSNSGIFIRCQDPKTLTAATCYEVNIWDLRPKPEYGTAAIVDVAKVVDPMPKAGGRWNTFHITANGDQLTVVMNGVKAVAGRDASPIKFKKVEIRPL